MEQKNQKIGTFSRTNDRSGDVGEQKHGEEWKNSSENSNTFLAAVTSSKDVHAMHKSSKEQKSEKIHADFSGTSRVIVCTGNSFRKKIRKSSQFGRAFSRKRVKRISSPHKKSKKVQQVVRFSQIDLLKGIESSSSPQQPRKTKL